MDKPRPQPDTGPQPADPVDEELLPSQPRPLWVRLGAGLVLLAFVAFVVVAAMPALRLPSLDFLAESYRLARDPVIRQWQQAVVEVRVAATEGDGLARRMQQRRATGFHVAPGGLVVTNHHVVAGAAAVTVAFAGSGSQGATSWQSLPAYDLAVISLRDADRPAAPVDLAGPLPQPGTEVTIIGNPLGLSKVVMRGQVTAHRRVAGLDTALLEIAAPIHQGHSGSPVFNAAGDVVAVIFAAISTDDPADRRGLAVPLAPLQTLLAEPPGS